jgi:cytoskeleton protein RodZ
MDSVGDTLRRERLRQNLDLQQVARETKIGVRLLEAIEADNFEKLPGGVFAKSFVRQYARVLGLDEEELATQVERMIQPPPEEPSAAEPAPPARGIEVPRVPEWEGS